MRNRLVVLVVTCALLTFAWRGNRLYSAGDWVGHGLYLVAMLTLVPVYVTYVKRVVKLRKAVRQ